MWSDIKVGVQVALLLIPALAIVLLIALVALAPFWLMLAGAIALLKWSGVF